MSNIPVSPDTAVGGAAPLTAALGMRLGYAAAFSADRSRLSDIVRAESQLAAMKAEVLAELAHRSESTGSYLSHIPASPDQ